MARRRKRASEEKLKLRRTNREIMAVCTVVTILFVGILGYMAYFLYNDADTYRNNSYNSKRQTLLEDKYTRGEIQASDGTTLAVTEVDDDGNETRTYPFGRIFAHVVGYTVNGVAGLESQAASYLLESHTNPLLRILDALQGNKSVGDTVTTTLNVTLQEVAYEALGDNDGAIVVLEPSTGKVLAMVSKPDFDPNTLAEDWDSLVSDDNTDANLVNRATQGLYTPGSTFKLLTVLEYIREYPNSWENFEFTCTGSYTVDGYTIKCSHSAVHGTQTLEEAFANSCNGAFAYLGQMLSFSSFYDLCESVGFNQTWSGGVPATASSFVLDNNNSLWDILQTSIGQGETTVTPIFNAMIAAAVCNDGVMMTPYLISSVTSQYGDKVESFTPTEYLTIMTEEEAEILQGMMELVVSDGTGDDAAGDGYTAAGKTGSAEVSSDSETNAWFIGYATSDSNPDKQIAVSVIVEGGGSGGSVAAPIAKKIFEAYFN
ncbi:MAG: penicillin-binding protein 2 [Lachnospiraceae bacterium]|nr:penicillin-binding protein 2 [Lachnospiraceae bacterium]